MSVGGDVKRLCHQLYGRLYYVLIFESAGLYKPYVTANLANRNKFLAFGKVPMLTQNSCQISKSICSIYVLKFSLIASESEVSFDRKLHVS